MNKKNVLIVMSNIDKFSDGTQTGIWFEEFVYPYQKLSENKFEITLASINGGAIPIDKESEYICNEIDCEKYIKLLKRTKKLCDIDYKSTTYKGIIIIGGHGAMYDLAESLELGELIRYFNCGCKLIATICHGCAGLINATNKVGLPFVLNKKLTCFSNEEEISIEKDKLVPFMLQSKLSTLGAIVENLSKNKINVVIDENLITAQNYQSSKLFAEKIVEYLEKDLGCKAYL